jgi:hypothetical protein
MTSTGALEVVELAPDATATADEPEDEPEPELDAGDTATPAPDDRADGNDRSTGGAGVRSSHHAVTATSNTAPVVVANRARVTAANTPPARCRQD